MAVAGRPPRSYTLTKTRVGDETYLHTQTFKGLKNLAEELGETEFLLGSILRCLGGEFSRKVLLEGGIVQIEHVKRSE